MIEAMYFVTVTGPKEDLERVTDQYLSQYSIQLENALTVLRNNAKLVPLTDKDPVRLGWIYPQNAKLSSHAEGFVRLLEQSIQRSIAYTSSLHRQIVGK